MDRVILTFTTPGGNYVYDRETNSLLSVSKTEYAAFQRVENKTTIDEDWQVIKRFTDHGYAKESCLSEIVHPYSFYIKFYLANRISQFTMQVTQNCNLRCKYCAFADNYDHYRSFSNKTMPLETMTKSVDFAMRHSRDVDEVVFGFYGGEPLLEIAKIKACVNYVKESYKERSVRYTVTTNGTIFDEEMILFFEENNFSVSISFDGPRELHDKNRVYQDGRGSFDKFMANLEHIREKHPDFFKKIFFLTVVAPGTDLACVNDFFDAADILADGSVVQNTVNSYNAKEDVIYDDLYHITYNYQSMKVILAAMGLYNKNKISKLFATKFTRIEWLYNTFSRGSMLEKSHPGGPCIPGAMRPFVDTDGNIYPCERVGENSEVMKIGHIDKGFDLAKVSAILNVGKVSEDACKSCWNFHHCGLCAASCDNGTSLSKELRLEKCASSKYETLEKLKAICLLLENGYDFEQEINFTQEGGARYA